MSYTKVYTPARELERPSSVVLSCLSDILEGREVAWRLFVRDFKAQYRQTILGYVWAFLPPLVAAFTFIFLQSQGITNIRNTGIEYAAFATIGALLWQTYVDAMLCPLVALQAAKPMLCKINFPREAILISGLYMVIVNLLVRMVLIIAIMLYFRIVPSLNVLWFPVAVSGLVLSGFAVGMVLVPIGGLYGDVARALPILAQFWMLITPVLYPLKEDGLAGFLAIWNPISPLIITARGSLINEPLGMLGYSLFVIVASAILSFWGLVAFRLVLPHLVSRMGG